jgi:hypothetical protein
MSFQEQIKNQNLEIKQNKWQEIERTVDSIRDKLEKRIDSNIKETVIALRALHINTTQSCEGHLNRGTYAPYIDIEAVESGELNKKLKLASKDEALVIVHEIEYKNLIERKKLLKHLEEFYTGRDVLFQQRLIVKGLARGWSRLESQGGDLQKIASADEKKVNLLKYQEEMNAFTEFLKKKFFESV